MTTTPLPNTLCPLCQSANKCAPAAEGSFDVPCWCQSERISQEARERVPADTVRSACLCQACVVRLNNLSS
ncbi:MAG: cysteine-rich CWC family protein [Pseudomonadaceae bacterium]|jgi:hypothetical protein